MRVNLFNTEPITPENVEYRPILDDLQGNILQEHGRDYAACLFLRFEENQALANKTLIHRFCSQHVTSASEQFQAGRDRPLVNFFLSADGYHLLGFADHQIPGDARFRKGMRASYEELRDPPPKQWDPLYRNKLHAMILVAHDDKDQLDDMLSRWRSELAEQCKRACTLLNPIERGACMFDRPATPAQGKEKSTRNAVEHFGYVDGISDPAFLQTQLKAAGSSAHWDSFAPLGLVLVPDFLGGSDHSCGSYLVFRKLEQNVKKFKLQQIQLAKKLRGGDQAFREDLAGALAVGRFKDGTPVTLSDRPQKHPSNDFTYSGNAPDSGARCPIHAHARSANPRRYPHRGGDQNPNTDRAHRIARRGMAYGKEKRKLVNGEPTFDEPDPPEAGVGTLFMCFQRDIGNQFEFIQSQWLNFENPGIGLDPVGGQGRRNSVSQSWPRQWTNATAEKDILRRGKAIEKSSFSFRDVVTLKGGEYFFAPSISFLRRIQTLPAGLHRGRRHRSSGER